MVTSTPLDNVGRFFSKGVSKQKYGVKNMFYENPVEVRSFERTLPIL
jgi:hypothetical protein